ncbi:MAG TPA: TMEM175 family protein [Candidatus Binatia bacterium]|nr:TMEM175 family protein [Candidatus Binatia bacterium]
MLSPRLVIFLMSVMTLGIFWVGQKTQLNHFARADRNLAWSHIAFLCSVSLTPFSTSLLAEFIHYEIALLVYWFNIFLL